MTSAPPIPSTSTEPSRRRVRLLVADDSLIARQSLVAFLETLQEIEVSAVCENGRLAVESALREEPDVVLLDLQMPVMSGLEAAEIFRNSMPHVGVILTSVHDQREVRATCLAGGADAFIGKATIKSDFPSVLARVLEQTRSPVRHRRAPGFARRPILDPFALALPSEPAGDHTPAETPGRGRSASDHAID